MDVSLLVVKQVYLLVVQQDEMEENEETLSSKPAKMNRH
jgi:hypothetical protein